MVMLSFVCWFLASLTFSSSLFLLPIPCYAAFGSCGWCCKKVELMVIFFFFLFFSAGWTFSRRVLLAWSGSCVIFQTLFPPVAPVPPFSCSFFLCFFVFSFPFSPLSSLHSSLVFISFSRCLFCFLPSLSRYFLSSAPSPPFLLLSLVLFLSFYSQNCMRFFLYNENVRDHYCSGNGREIVAVKRSP